MEEARTGDPCARQRIGCVQVRSHGATGAPETRSHLASLALGRSNRRMRAATIVGTRLNLTEPG